MEQPIHLSNLALVDPIQQATRVRMRQLANGKKVRIAIASATDVRIKWPKPAPEARPCGPHMRGESLDSTSVTCATSCRAGQDFAITTRYRCRASPR
jgi:hypothetical protein